MAQISTRKRGNTWEYSFEVAPVNGKRKRKSKGGFRTKKECLEAGTKAKAEYDNKGYINEPKKILFNDYLDYWYENEVKINKKTNTQIGYWNVVKNHFKPYFDGHYLNSVTPAVCNNFVNTLKLTGLSEGYILTIGKILNSALNYAVFPCEFIDSNPMRYIKIKSAKSNVDVISYETFNLILDRLKPYYYIPFYIAWYTGARIGEITALTWNDIDFENNTITFDKTTVELTGGGIEFQIPKTPNAIRTILVSQKLLDMLKDWKNKQQKYAVELMKEEPDLICTRDSLSHIRPSSIQQYLIKVCKQLNIDVHFHQIRHTHATMLIQNGASAKDVQLRLGHSKIETTLNVYVHNDLEASRNSVNIIDNLTT